MTADSAPSPIVDNPTPWVAKQIGEYLESDGTAKIFRGGIPLLLLTTQGRKTGTWHRTALICDAHGDDWLIVASIGGAPKHPVWYLNLQANPRVWIQVGADAFWAIARTASPSEKPELWDQMVGVYADYADYQKKTDRDIPVVVLTRE